MRTLKYSLVFLVVFSLWGCGKGNPSAPVTVNPATNKAHDNIPNWIGVHGQRTPVSALSGCAECHGGDFQGGIVGIGCITCHENGPANGVTIPHLLSGNGYTAKELHGADAKRSLLYCARCHGTGSNKPFIGIKNNIMTEGCATSPACHWQNPNLAHPYGWTPGLGGSTTTHSSAGDLLGSCGICHGGNALTGSSVAPSCSSAGELGITCHSRRPVDNAGKSIRCASCHDAIPGSVVGQSKVRHDAHWALGNNHFSCDYCHNVYPSNQLHRSGTVMVGNPVLAKFGENGVAGTYNATSKKCSNVSCHGGKSTGFPAWAATATFTMTCINCHVDYAAVGVVAVPPSSYSGPYIGPFSGNQRDGAGNVVGNLHEAHLSFFGVAYRSNYCLFCHTTPALSVHFANITSGKRRLQPGTAGFSIDANVYIQSVVKDTQGAVISCTTKGNAPLFDGTGLVGCHGVDDTVFTPRPWY